jgi:putative ABC transport system permease protein
VDEIIRAGGQEILTGTAPLVPLISTGLLLTVAGVYGVLAFAVARRRRELAVRVVVGANRRDLVRMVTAQLLTLVGAGLGLGIGLTFALSQIVRVTGEAGSVYAPEPVAFAVPVIVVGVLAVVAAWLPARRAGAIDPVILLRTS